MTTTERSKITAQIAQAQHRAERAAHYGDHAGSLIAAGDARRLMRRLDADRTAHTHTIPGRYGAPTIVRALPDLDR